MEEDPYLFLKILSQHSSSFFSFDVIVATIILIFLFAFSAFFSGSEFAFFALKSNEIEELRKDKSNVRLINLIKNPNKLLATILIANNLINISIIILLAYISSITFEFHNKPKLEFILEVLIITLLLLLFGQITPKTYANKNARAFSVMMAYPISLLEKIFYPLSYFLINSTNFIDKRLKKKQREVSIDNLAKALDLTKEDSKLHEKKILRSIIEFGDTDVKEIMKSRLDVFAIKNDLPFKEVVEKTIKSSYSRIPVYKDQIDNVIGILYIKDLIPYLNEDSSFNWIKLCRGAYYVPENKMINSLLKEFQVKKNHIAIVVDEYGGMSGIVTLEDVLEEIVGEINDEFDLDENIFSKLDDKNYIFEGKISLIDFLKIVEGDSNYFDYIKGDADSLAGLIVEQEGRILKKGETCVIPPYVMMIEAADNKRITKIKVTIDEI